MADDVGNVNIIKCVALFYKLGAAPKDFILKENFRTKLPRSLYCEFVTVKQKSVREHQENFWNFIV